MANMEIRNTREYSVKNQEFEDYVKPHKPSIPCIEQKCLKYPVCKTKRYIICKDLLDRYREIESEGSWDVWDVLSEYFPKIVRIHPTKKQIYL